MTGPTLSPPRPAAHCAELLGAGPSIADMVRPLTQLGEKLARALPALLARVTASDPPVVRIGIPEHGTLDGLAQSAEALAAHALMGLGPRRLPLVASFEAAPVLRLLDRTFGGRGVVPHPLPSAFPLSAELLLARIEDAIATALSAGLGGDETHRVHPLRRDTSLTRLAPFRPTEPLLRLVLDVEEADAEAWSLALVLPLSTLEGALVVPRRKRRAPSAAPRPGIADEPFTSLPLEVTAVLVDMALPFSRLSALRPGDVLPVTVARAVPLKVDGRTIAVGTVGEVEDRVAVQVQNAF
ncbi:flagellar motor switch protein FliM [Novosphingobium sp. Leaf2]|uniref:flagellar motor switch protein FliM n=1 Tax=Novosphingobium sp. Leaf2 TaxID=1735670 RepID=UPI0006FD4F48|nr:flagellar motor switch protein FliM [Novosphingobium sp. Leaf2]KQM14831.1 flagellar motor switch protein FliM [Novosphingobium sp. Leaf2]